MSYTLNGQTLSKHYPFLKKVDIIAKVAFNSQDGYFYFSFVLKNHVNNIGKIEEFRMDISRNYGTVEYDTLGLKFDTNNGDWEERQFREEYFHLRSHIVPISYFQLPPYWSSVWGNQWAASISNVHEPILPGVDVDGFVMMSKGLPCIRRIVIEPEFQDVFYFPNIEDTTVNMSIEQMDSIREAVNFRGFTIGPTAPPIDFIGTVWCDTLLSYTRQSVQLGWLRDGKDNDCDNDEKLEDGVVKNLENRLLKARNELNEGDTIKASPIGASRELEKFIKKVERISKRSDVMTDEAYALLKYNAEYLLEHLITLPPKPKGTLLEQIDSLKIEVQNQSKKKNIGGVIFVKGLTLLIDKARKELVKKDSSETALYIALFQLVVDETWELTQKLEEKKKKFAALYVLDEAYIVLHHRAEYILEALPEPRRSVHEQRQQMMKEDSSLKEIQQELGTMKKSVE
jgi:hypothetical protein